jgi:hypothetical protein
LAPEIARLHPENAVGEIGRFRPCIARLTPRIPANARRERRLVELTLDDVLRTAVVKAEDLIRQVEPVDDDGKTQPAIEGSGVDPLPGQGRPIKAGEFILGYPGEAGVPLPMPQPWKDRRRWFRLFLVGSCGVRSWMLQGNIAICAESVLRSPLKETTSSSPM